jgi:hypothetical protein
MDDKLLHLTRTGIYILIMYRDKTSPEGSCHVPWFPLVALGITRLDIFNTSFTLQIVSNTLRLNNTCISHLYRKYNAPRDNHIDMKVTR